MSGRDLIIRKTRDEFREFLYEWVPLNVRQNRRLAGLRDTLLPKLLSGEIDPGTLPEAEAIAEEVSL